MEIEEVSRNYQNKYLLSTPLRSDFGGGLNVRVSPPEVKITQAMVCKNIIFNAASGALRPRDGTSKLISTVFPLPALEEHFGIFQAPFSTGKKLLVNTSLRVWTWTSPNWVDITGTASRTAPASKKVNMAFYNDLAIGVDGTNVAFKVPTSLVAAPLGGTPPVCKFIVVWNDYVVMAGDSTNKVYYSERENPESWPVVNFLTAGGNTDGDPITGIAVAYGHLIIFKRNSIYAVSGATATDFSISQIGRSTGLVAEGAHCNAENNVWFLGPSGMYMIGSDLSPQFQSDFVLPRYQSIIAALASDNSNLPSVTYNSAKQQVWVSVHFPSDVTLDKTMVHDLINKDATGRPAVSEYFFYNGGTDATNLNPRFSIQYLSSSNEFQVVSMNRNNYVYLHDRTLAQGATGDDGNAVSWVWQSKYLNLGDPMRLKTLRYYTVMGDSLGGQPAASNRNYEYSVSGDSWTAKTPMTYPRRGCGVASLNSKVYVAGGYDGVNTLAYLESYDPATDAWTTLAAMPTALAYGAMVSDGTYLYHIGGYNTDTLAYSNKVYRYNATLNTWSAMTNMTTARMWLGAEIVSGVIYCIGGYNGSTLGTNEAYSIAGNSWSTKTSMTTPRYLLTSSAVNDKIYCIGGFPFANATKNEEYDTVGDSWATKAPLTTARYEHSASVVSSKVYVLGGYASATALSDVVEYNPSGDTYAAKTAILSTRYWGGGAVVSGKIYLVGGQGLPATLAFLVSDDFTNITEVSFDLSLNTRKEIPAAANYQKRYWSIKITGNIIEGITQITGWNLDYTMFQRRN